MNSLTVNIHLMFATFYRPSGARTKVIMEDIVFPSDGYAIASQVRWHGLDPDEHVIHAPRRGGGHPAHGGCRRGDPRPR
jgi:kynureninase